MRILVDSREKRPWEFDSAETVALETGDYTVEGVDGAIERKTADDLLKSITWDRDRFEAECQRASAFDEPLIIIVEEPWSFFENEEYYQDVHPNAIESTVEAWERRYNIEFEFTDDRDEARDRALEILDGWRNP